MRRYVLWGMEVDPDLDTQKVCDTVAEALTTADVGRFKPDESTKGVAVVLTIPTDRQREINAGYGGVDSAGDRASTP